MLKTLLQHLKDSKDAIVTNDILIEVFNNSIAPLKHKDANLYNEIVNGLYVECYGEHFSDWLAQHAVHQMKNVDGSEGEHWSIGQIDDIIRQHSIKCDNFNRWDLYYVMNMFFSDYYNVFGTDTSTYVKLSKAWFNDVDVLEGKAYRYYMNVVKSK